MLFFVVNCVVEHQIKLLNGFCKPLDAWMRHNCQIRLENLRYCTILCLTENKERLI